MNDSAPSPSLGSERPLSLRRLYVLVLLAAAVLYVATCQRGVSWQDSGIFQYRAERLDLTGHLGLALAHPLYILAGWLLKFVPVGGFAWRLNLFSGLGMAVACANLAAVCMLLTGRRWIALAAAAMIALAHTPWWLASVAEVYTWSLAGFTAELWLLVALLRRPGWGKLAGLALVSGLGLCVHNFALLPLPVYAVVAVGLVARKRLPAWSLAVAAGAYLLGAGMYLAMIAIQIAGGAGVGATVRSALFGNYQAKVFNARVAPDATGKGNLMLMLLNVLGPQLLCVLGAWSLRRRAGRATAAALGALTAIHLLFVLRYNVPDQFTFVLPSLAMLSLLAAVGLAQLADRGERYRQAAGLLVAAWVLAAPVAYALVTRVAASAGVQIARPRTLPYRNETRYWLVPWKFDERSAERFTEDVLAPDGVDRDAYIVADATAFYPLAVAQRLGDRRPDVTLLGGHEPWPIPSPDDDIDAFFSAVGDRPVYVVSPVVGYCPQALLDHATFSPADGLYRVRRR